MGFGKKYSKLLEEQKARAEINRYKNYIDALLENGEDYRVIKDKKDFLNQLILSYRKKYVKVSVK